MNHLGRHRAFYVAAAIGLLALLAGLMVLPERAYTIGANFFFIPYLVLTAIEMPRLDAAYLSRRAEDADEPVWIIFVVTLAVIAVAVGSLFVVMNGRESPRPFDFIFSLASLPLGWATIHMMTALHYAHLFWKPQTAADSGKKGRAARTGGLEFPGTKEPCGWDFLYFSMVVGMTSQTSDIDVTASDMRRVVMLHSILSFFFNTVIVAAAVNLVVSLSE